jgi:hypothetical protein
MSDRLTLAHAIEDAGIERSKAERMASVIFDAIHDNVATKADVAAVRADLTLVEHRLLTRLGGLMVVLVGVLFAALRYWPPGHG